ncbi:hypothetical protein D1641_18375 [Colidextribacter sp. OB.20]|uniref:hypothetical protein n=1 Tax=Colidextribacter sp. OB.20 TaxID=2304568 RepID=UPI00136DB10D|nr:hypothetical protein [Colidextribacter sp. OB.20]NBI11934.1 hypothetical protein [Colidextribacter sp. OB.20]
MPAKKHSYIRFVDGEYQTMFHLPDGGRIRITYPDGSKRDRACRFIDICHTNIGGHSYHIFEFAQHMERIGARYEPLDYIREPAFYPKHFFAADEKAPGPAYYIIDTTETHGFAYAPNGAAKGRKYCIFDLRTNERGSLRFGKVVMWGGTLKELYPKDWGFNPKKISAATQRPRKRAEPER